MHSCLYIGRLQHRRFEPNAHAFCYPVVYAYLDLDELDRVFARRWLWSTTRAAPVRFRRADYLGPAGVPLGDAVRALVARETGQSPAGPIRMLTHLRYWGFSYNPVTFYYCFHPTGDQVDTLVADITNTPWNERHAYVLPRTQSLSQSADLRFRFGKTFHVSPFMPMQMQYDWMVPTPGQRLMIHMKALDRGRSVFDATLELERRRITGVTCARALIGYPLMPMKVIAAIYWQALQLSLKRTPFYAHPSTPTHTTHGGAQSATYK